MGHSGRVIASGGSGCSIRSGVEFIRGDFTEDDVFELILAAIDGKPVDLVISESEKSVIVLTTLDQPRSMYLVELALDMARRVLAPGGSFVAKVFQGEGFESLLGETRDAFGKVLTRKPRASRPRSREVYLVAKHFRG